MPNHCENDLVVRGDSAMLREFMEFAKGPVGTAIHAPGVDLLSAHRFIPYPEEYNTMVVGCKKCGTISDKPVTEDPFQTCPQCDGFMMNGYNRGGYEWCIENWGTKWGLYEVDLLEEDLENGHLNYYFETAWSPPEPVILAMSKRFPGLEFQHEYFESGAGYQGGVRLQAGEAVEEFQAPYWGHRGG